MWDKYSIMNIKAAAVVTNQSEISDPCEAVKDVKEEGLEIVDRLRAALQASSTPGIGLAANQIGINKRVFVMNIPHGDFYLGHAFINPTLEDLKDPILFNEGCLSFPGESVETFRFNEVVVRDDLSPEGRAFKGVAAVCAQHELNHLDGLTMYDKELSKVQDDDCPCGSEKKLRKCCLMVARNRKKSG